ncbi:MAG: VWA domain-containing protein, partial [Deltaproteobacteria bacterium]|nr:VWA domain-containing protein [Deltaproteobacteria bacterium]
MRVLISPKEAFKRVKRDFSNEDFNQRADQLIDRVIRFVNLLRQNRLGVHTSNEMDAIHALSLVDINDPFQFYLALKTCMITSHTQLSTFNRLYLQFWGTGPRLKKQTEGDEEESGQDEKSVTFKRLDESPSDDRSRKGSSKHSDIYEEVPTFTYSAVENLKQKDFEDIPQAEVAMMDQIFRRLQIKIREKKGRRFKPAKSGQMVDLRRTIRQSTQRGGEIVDILKRERKPKESKIVVLADVSGSMDAYSRFLIKFIYEMQRFLRDTETFVFGTRIRRITDLLNNRSVTTSISMVSKEVLFWSGGTNIGGS